MVFDTVQTFINNDLNNMSDMHLADLDGDDDLDIILASHYPDVLAWIRNDGNATFSSPIIIDDVIQNPNSIDVGDIDLDGNMDILIEANYSVIEGEGESNTIVWYGNTNGLGEFSGANKILVFGPDNKMAKLADMDLDGDLDVVCALGGWGVNWIENVAPGFFWSEPKDIMDENITLSVLDIGDVDADGDLDVVYSDHNSEAIYLSINRNGLGDFDEAEIIYEKSSGGLKLEDMDNDGDLDLVAMTEIENVNDKQNIYYVEQVDGSFSGVEIKVNETVLSNAKNISIADVDNDGDMDVMSASRRDDKIAWYENLNVVSIQEVASVPFAISPVPVSNLLWIESEIDLRQVRIYNVEGKFQLMSKDVERVDVSSLVSGLYIIQVVDDKGFRSAMKFVKL